jgi:hypothetical protein
MMAWGMGHGGRCFLLFTNYFLLDFLWNADETDELRSARIIADFLLSAY